MKVTPTDLDMMRQAITDMPPNADMRERWDSLWRAVDAGRMNYTDLNDYLDDHIDTALRRISKDDTTSPRP